MTPVARTLTRLPKSQSLHIPLNRTEMQHHPATLLVPHQIHATHEGVGLWLLWLHWKETLKWGNSTLVVWLIHLCKVERTYSCFQSALIASGIFIGKRKNLFVSVDLKNIARLDSYMEISQLNTNNTRV
ncbi:hypothetical protein TSAR_010996 [Trichomalopsis sarcophagae]|uniref:Uncharacterized protein n=1 Tax=Trichomalopsis sarcophagae TaxID=543379 RepID=A0A232ELH3_9HYME|nr:hypothetical protein TSAR_010996 [Trichomalopsis sarcophagae]